MPAMGGERSGTTLDQFRSLYDGYVFIMAILSTQISSTLLRRYRNANMLVLVGNNNGNPMIDTFAFIEQIVGYSVPSFFKRNSDLIRGEVETILKELLSPK